MASDVRRSTGRVTTHSHGLLRATVHSEKPAAPDRKYCQASKPPSLQASKPFSRRLRLDNCNLSLCQWHSVMESLDGYHCYSSRYLRWRTQGLRTRLLNCWLNQVSMGCNRRVQFFERILFRLRISVVTNSARPLSTVSRPNAERNWMRR
jgi:hypothetical protein